MSELEKIKRELKAARLMRLIEKDMMEDNFTMCREAAFFWKGKAEAMEKENFIKENTIRSLRDKVTPLEQQNSKLWEKCVKLEAENGELKKQVEDLKCCGNCKHTYLGQYSENQREEEYEINSHKPSDYCDKHEPDGRTKEDRG